MYMTNVTPEDIDAVCKLVDDLCGIYWDESKSYLIESRLSSLVARHGCAGYADLARKVRSKQVPGLTDDVVNAVTTNETLWFRDNSPFEALRFKLFPELIDSKVENPFPKRFRIWSAACSTGQEVYSIAMAFADLVPDWDSWDFQILGTDISPEAVTHAQCGCYNDLEISRGMDKSRLQKYFLQDGNHWRIRNEIQRMCRFSVRNLHEPFIGLSNFDIIFCRNVAIYFNAEDRRKLFEKLADALSPEGWLLTGSSESLLDLGPRWKPQMHCRASCYQPNKVPVAYV